MSVNVIGGYNPWNRKGKKGDNDKIVHWLIQPELRYWFCEPAGGHFIGIHAIATQYNIGGHKFSIFSIKDIGMKVGEQVQDLRMGIVGCFREDGRSKPIWV